MNVDVKSESLLTNTEDLLGRYMGDPLINFAASSISDIGRGPGSTSNIFCINY